jgi:hypothetical protein
MCMKHTLKRLITLQWTIKLNLTKLNLINRTNNVILKVYLGYKIVVPYSTSEVKLFDSIIDLTCNKIFYAYQVSDSLLLV